MTTILALTLLAAVLIDGHRTRREIRTTALLAEEARVGAETSARTAGLIANTQAIWRD